MSISGKPQWVTRKYMGDDNCSWAVIDKRYLPKGHRGVVFEWLPQGAVAYNGLNRASARYYLSLVQNKQDGGIR